MIIVPGYIAAGDITGVTAGVGLSGGGTSETVTLTLDLSELSAVTPANGDSLSTLDSDGANEQLTTVASLATLFAGDGLAASSSVLGLDLVSNGGLEISSNKLQVATGISQYDVAQFAASVVDNDFLRIATTSVEGLSAAEVAAAIEGSIDAVGTIASGTWEGTTIAVDQGGTGATSLNNLITLATHTTGDFVGTITAGTGLTSTGGTSGEDVDHGLSVDAAQTGITSAYNTSLKMGRDSQNLIDFATTDNKIILRVNNVDEVELVENALSPVTSDGVALGTGSLMWSDLFLASASVINFNNGDVALTHSSNAVTLSGGDLALTDASVQIDSGPTDETVSGITASFTAGEALSRGEVVYFKASDSKMWKAVASAAGTMPVAAMAAADISADAAGIFLLFGFLGDNGTFPAYTVGADLYAPEAETSSENVPEEAAPDTDGDFVQVVGYAVTANSVFFNPDQTIVEVA